ncbi:MAG: cell division protein ZapA [Cytophagales bacterium]|nr:MAG: cell division protein ZapA [Cytophagales bacterium]
MNDTKLSIKIRIAEREYPMKADISAEPTLRMAGKKLNEKIHYYRTEFGIEDRQDLLAMVAFDCMVELLNIDKENTEKFQILQNKLTQWDNTINDALSAD